MPANKLSREGDQNDAGGRILKGAQTVFCNGKAVGLHTSKISAHAPWDLLHPPHDAAITMVGSPTVFAENKPVLRVTSGNSCGHKIIQGSDNVFVP